MKKLISMLMVFVLVLSALALVSCSGDENASSDSEEGKNENTSNGSESSNASDEESYVPEVSAPGEDTVAGRYTAEIDFARIFSYMMSAAYGKEYTCDPFVVEVGLALDEDGKSDAYVIKYATEEKNAFYDAVAKAAYDYAVAGGYAKTLEEFIDEAGGMSTFEEQAPLNSFVNIFDGEYKVENGKLTIVVGESEQDATNFCGTVANGIVTITGEYDANGTLIDGDSIFPIEFTNIYA